MSQPPADADDRVVPPAELDPDRITAAEVHAAGGVVYRWGDGGVEVLVVHRPRYDDWSLPKGKLDANETFEAAAIREIREETGVEGSLGPDLGAVFYRDHKNRAKVVRWWAIQADVIGQPSDTDEVDAVRWARPTDAAPLLTYPLDVEVLEAFRATVGP